MGYSPPMDVRELIEHLQQFPPDWQVYATKAGRVGVKSGTGFYTRAGKDIHTLDWKTGEYRPIQGLGRYNHENTISLNGNRNGKIGLLSTDDTFDGPSAQLYLYLARRDRAVWHDRGHLFAFRVTEKNGEGVTPGDAFNGANDYLERVNRPRANDRAARQRGR